MKQLKFPTVFAVFIVAIAAFMFGLFVGRSTAGNTMYVVQDSTLPPEVTEASEDASQPKETEGKKEKLNINTATVKELDALPGVGEVIAQRIVDYRLENGSFITIEELMEVSGIGEKMFEEIRDYITVR